MATERGQGTLVWAKVPGYEWWPARCIELARVPVESTRDKVAAARPGGAAEAHRLLSFFGDGSYFWLRDDELLDFDEHLEAKSAQTKKALFRDSVAAAREARRRQLAGEDDPFNLPGDNNDGAEDDGPVEEAGPLPPCDAAAVIALVRAGARDWVALAEAVRRDAPETAVARRFLARRVRDTSRAEKEAKASRAQERADLAAARRKREQQKAQRAATEVQKAASAAKKERAKPAARSSPATKPKAPAAADPTQRVRVPAAKAKRALQVLQLMARDPTQFDPDMWPKPLLLLKDWRDATYVHEIEEEAGPSRADFEVAKPPASEAPRPPKKRVAAAMQAGNEPAKGAKKRSKAQRKKPDLNPPIQVKDWAVAAPKEIDADEPAPAPTPPPAVKEEQETAAVKEDAVSLPKETVAASSGKVMIVDAVQLAKTRQVESVPTLKAGAKPHDPRAGNDARARSAAATAKPARKDRPRADLVNMRRDVYVSFPQGKSSMASEPQLRAAFARYGSIEKLLIVVPERYAHVKFHSGDAALTAMKRLSGNLFGNPAITMSLDKPAPAAGTGAQAGSGGGQRGPHGYSAGFGRHPGFPPPQQQQQQKQQQQHPPRPSAQQRQPPPPQPPPPQQQRRPPPPPPVQVGASMSQQQRQAQPPRHAQQERRPPPPPPPAQARPQVSHAPAPAPPALQQPQFPLMALQQQVAQQQQMVQQQQHFAAAPAMGGQGQLPQPPPPPPPPPQQQQQRQQAPAALDAGALAQLLQSFGGRQ